MPRPKVGDTFQERYLIHAELGAGGMGAVYRALQIDADREVALKFLKAEEKYDDETINRFFREFKLLSRVSHPNIVTIYGMALDDDDVPFAICEFLEGTNLKKVLSKENHLSWQRTVKIALQICEAMQYAHESGIVHRDLKPENVMLLDKPEADFVKIVDFGLSRIFFDNYEESRKITVTGQLVGTANYMSPELISKKADARSDVYSLGCMIFEMLAGEFLFDADTAVGVVYKHCNEDARARFSVIKTAVPKKLLDVLARTLHKDPDQRYQSMKELSRDLQELRENPMELAPVKVSRVLFNKTSKLALAVGVVAVLAGLGIGFVILQVKQRNPEKNSFKLGSTNMAKKASAMLLILAKTQDELERKRLAEDWLAKHASASAEEKIMILEDLFRTEIALKNGTVALNLLQKIQELLPDLDEAIYEQAALKNRMFYNLAVAHAAKGDNSGAIKQAVKGLRMFLKMDGERPMVETQGNLRVLLFCGDYLEGVELATKFLAKIEPYLGTDRQMETRFLMNLADLQIGQGAVEDAKKNYEKAVGLAPEIQEKDGQIHRLTGVELTDRRFIGAGKDIGLPYIFLGERMYYLEPARGKELFSSGVQLVQEEQKATVRNGQEQISRAYRTQRLKPLVWINLSNISDELELPQLAERCAIMATKAVSAANELRRPLLSFLSYKTLAKCHASNGKFDEALLEIKNAVNAADSFPKVHHVRFYAELAEISVQCKNKDYAEELLAKSQKLNGVYNLTDTQSQLAIARTLEALSRPKEAKPYWDRAWNSAHELASFDQLNELSWRLGNTPEESINPVRIADPPKVGLVFLVDGLLKYGYIQRAVEAIETSKHADERLARALCLFELAKVYERDGKFRQAKECLLKAHEIFLSSPKDPEYMRGIPLNLRCKLLLSQLSQKQS